MEYALQTFGLTKKYKNALVVDHVSMNVRRGDIYGFVGRNGAGKTTLMRLVCGLVCKTDGDYSLFCCSDGDKEICRVRKRVGAIIESPAVFPEMTAFQNLKQQSLALGIRGDDRANELLRYVGLENTSEKKAKNFSLGMRQRLGIAMALVGDPDFLILDEPINGLDPQGIVEVRELLLRLHDEKSVTILISSHILSELSKLATRYGFIEKGVLVKEISAEELDASCRKAVCVTVSDTQKLPLILENKLGLCDYKILSATAAEIYADVNVGDLAAVLREADVALYRVNEKDEDLEGYFLNLVGGDA